ncbi:MAG TPA: M23 family metallopeptidase [Verrucomicrobiae bacterium]|nr:M23 family metallopeptidase [Verrucomicrobiae bacterium]
MNVVTTREGETTRFVIENLEETEITVTFELELKNLKGTTNFPFTAVFAPKKVTEAFKLFPADTNAGWNYSYTCRYTIGSTAVKHDNSYVYSLPYAQGATFKVTQGYNGSYSHTGPEQYAIDWKMSPGTPVHAARDGVVVKIKDDSDKGGPDRKFENAANYILIRHADGSIGNYAHLSKAGAKVLLGQKVKAGDLIGLSGNSGFSTGPHLHFAVFKTKNGSERESIPVRFRTLNAAAVTLAEGQSYGCPASTETLLADTPRRASSPKSDSLFPLLGKSDRAQGGSQKPK